MKRSDLLGALKAASPALGSASVLPAFANFWFEEPEAGGSATVLAYDDLVAVKSPLPEAGPGFAGGIVGTQVLRFLGACDARTVGIEERDGHVVFKAGRARLKAQLWDAENVPFAFPSFGDALRIELDGIFLAALERATVSMEKSAAESWRQGVTLRIEEGVAHFYASDGASLSHAWCSVPKGVSAVTVLSPEWVKIVLGAGEELTALLIHEAWVAACFAGGLEIFTRAKAEPDAERFEELLESTFSGVKLVEIPAQLEKALARALAVSGAPEQATLFAAKEGVLKLRTSAPTGVVLDEMEIDETHPDVKAKLDPNLVRRVLKYGTTWALPSDGFATVLEGPEFRHVLAVVMTEEEDEE